MTIMTHNLETNRDIRVELPRAAEAVISLTMLILAISVRLPVVWLLPSHQWVINIQTITSTVKMNFRVVKVVGLRCIR